MMKVTKNLIYLALIASTASIVSCSEDALDSNATKDSGIPLKVYASVNNSDTRASDNTALNNFQLWGFKNVSASKFSNVTFTKSGDAFNPSSNLTWPNATGFYTFYAISNNTEALPTGVTDNIMDVAENPDETKESFTYAMPYTVVDGKNVVTIASQKDLLVAAATGSVTTPVNLKFDHALTAAKLKLKLDPLTTNYGNSFVDGTDYRFLLKIRKITIHNVKISGTYTFDGYTLDSNNNFVNGSWDTSNGTLGDYVIDFGDTPLLIQQNTSDGTGETDIDVDGNGGNIYFIPQTITPWNILPNTIPAADVSIPGTSGKNGYIEFESISMVYIPSEVVTKLKTLTGVEGWTKDENGFYYNSEKIANADGTLVTAANSDMTDAGYTSGMSKSRTKTLLNGLVGTDKNHWKIDTNGDFVYSATADFNIDKVTVANSAGVVQDFDNENLNGLGAAVTTECYNTEGAPLHTFRDIITDDLYGIFYTPLKVTLATNGKRVLRVSVDKGVRKADSSSVFGIGAEAGT